MVLNLAETRAAEFKIKLLRKEIGMTRSDNSEDLFLKPMRRTELMLVLAYISHLEFRLSQKTSSPSETIENFGTLMTAVDTIKNLPGGMQPIEKLRKIQTLANETMKIVLGD